METDSWGPEVARHYDTPGTGMFAPELLGSTAEFLAELAGDGSALEFAIGTGRVGLALKQRGVKVHGIELSAAMVEQLRTKPGGDEVPVVIGDMATTRVDGTFSLVYLVYNTIMNLRTQDEQVACFENAAAHLESGGCFVIELIVPKLRQLPPGSTARAFVMTKDYVAFEEFTDLEHQIAWSHHYWVKDGSARVHSAPYRYVWPAELDLMARIAGMKLRERWADWNHAPFGYDSPSHISVYEKA